MFFTFFHHKSLFVKEYFAYFVVFRAEVICGQQAEVRHGDTQQSPGLLRHDGGGDEQHDDKQGPLPRQRKERNEGVDHHQQGPEDQIDDIAHRVAEGGILNLREEEGAECIDGEREHRDGQPIGEREHHKEGL